MKFGKEFGIHLEQTLPEWKDKYLCYKPLKKLLKHLPNHTADDVDDHPQPVNSHRNLPHHLDDLQQWFVRILNEELDKFNDFYVDREEEFVIRFQELKQRIERVKDKSCKDGVFTSESEFSEEMMAIRKDFVTIHGEMVLLKNYSSLNFAGIIKILKKYDKRTGGLLRVHFTQLALRQPFFTTEPLTRLVHECEENLELLFPLVAEVVESTSGMYPATANTTTVPLSFAEGTSDVYRRTVDAIRTIKGLKKESSTSNPLSFASIFGTQDTDTGAITAEDSPSDSSTSSQYENDHDESRPTE
ncbi:SPX domain-containing protein 4-like [Cynara cardunculus var. scolymus]|uniref:SPX, N-terminal n=1 Tax=Cynara cardunculus var. scolymus TaxID=59895 RepID=A0A103XL84_CYNCS|nr:SPX domain-containing protein 4-like [Cynara cardunculus var. scolymus]KVH92723.1 SPX, N-terminal [Cynara cardunculus var. scolymus]